MIAQAWDQGEVLLASCFYCRAVRCQGKEPPNIYREISPLRELSLCCINPNRSTGEACGLARKLCALATASCVGMFHPCPLPGLRAGLTLADSRQERDRGHKGHPKEHDVPGTCMPEEMEARNLGSMIRSRKGSLPGLPPLLDGDCVAWLC